MLPNPDILRKIHLTKSKQEIEDFVGSYNKIIPKYHHLRPS